MAFPTLLCAGLLASSPTTDEGASRQLRPCLASVGDENLQPLLECYYAKGQRFIYPGPKDLLSADSVKLLPPGPYVELLTTFTVNGHARALEKNDYVAVSVRTQRGGCEITSTQTWFEEAVVVGKETVGQWRRVFVPAAELALAESDRPETARMLLETANQWLDTDPFAVRPIEKLIEILKNGERLVEAKALVHEPSTRHGTVAQLIERARVINADDDTAIAISVQHAPFKDAAAAYKHLKTTSCLYENTTSQFVRRHDNAGQLMKFATPLAASAVISNAVAGRLAELKAPKELAAWLTPERTAALMKYVETLVPQLRGGVAARLAYALRGTAPAQAKDWLALAVRLEPDDRLVKAVAKELAGAK